jgi:glycosyltransferase involved in cell wall biosynthesis
LNILWLLDVKHRYGLRHGATLRYLHFSRGMVAKGHRVFFVVTNHGEQDVAGRASFLEQWKNDRVLTDYVEVSSYKHPRWLGKLSWLAFHPRARNAMLSFRQAEYRNTIQQLVKRWSTDVCIISERASLFLLPRLNDLIPTIIDWCDSGVLYAGREIRTLVRSMEIRRVPVEARNLVRALADETFYSRYSVNLVVSRVDKTVFDVLNRRPGLNQVISNGVDPPSKAHSDGKDPRRLIISGTMDFPPNYQGALWFIENVFPALLKNRPDLRLVIAGQRPVPALLAKASERIIVTGQVADMGSEIARSQLFVAPLVSGGGFKNKVVEALANETYVVGTPLAFEFLGEKLRSSLLLARSATEFVAHIERYLDHPEEFAPRLREALRMVQEEYVWEIKVGELEDLCLRVTASRARSHCKNESRLDHRSVRTDSIREQ